MNDGERFNRCIAAGGVAVFPADTVYGVACDPENRFAVERLYLLKRRSLEKPSAVMFFDLDDAFIALPELGERIRIAMRRLLPGPLGLLLPNPAARFPLACGPDPSVVGVRVPRLDWVTADRRPVLQSSANRTGGADPRTIAEVPRLLTAGADLVIDRGELPGTPSTLIDLHGYEESGRWRVVREGAIDPQSVAAILG